MEKIIGLHGRFLWALLGVTYITSTQMPFAIPWSFLDTRGTKKCNPRLGIYLQVITTLWKMSVSLVNNLSWPYVERQAVVMCVCPWVCRAVLSILPPQIPSLLWPLGVTCPCHPAFFLLRVLSRYEDIPQTRICWGPQITFIPRTSLENGPFNSRYPLTSPH